MVGRLGYPANEEGLPIDLSSSLSLVTESGLCALPDEVGLLHVVESDAVELLCTLSSAVEGSVRDQVVLSLPVSLLVIE